MIVTTTWRIQKWVPHFRKCTGNMKIILMICFLISKKKHVVVLKAKSALVRSYHNKYENKYANFFVQPPRENWQKQKTLITAIFSIEIHLHIVINPWETWQEQSTQWMSSVQIQQLTNGANIEILKLVTIGKVWKMVALQKGSRCKINQMRKVHNRETAGRDGQRWLVI